MIKYNNINNQDFRQARNKAIVIIIKLENQKCQFYYLPRTAADYNYAGKI